MTPRLESLSITDFRSISGTITVPLDAPVVLIHGPNGAGKTSILSALELALTGDVPAMRRTDPDYVTHLPHRGADRAHIALRATGLGPELEGASIAMGVSGAGPEAAPLLSGSDARTFSERCYLAQSTLGRLLEIYQYASPREDSPLTRFVKDLLGIDQLEALIEGLKAAGDIRRTRRLVPEFKEAEDLKRKLSDEHGAATKTIALLRQQAIEVEGALNESITLLPVPVGRTRLRPEEPDALQAFLGEDAEEPLLVAIARQRRDLAAVRAHWQASAAGIEAGQRESAETEDRDATLALESWRATTGVHLETLLDRLRTVFPDLPSAAFTDPELARSRAEQLTAAEVKRCEALVAHDDAVAVQRARLDDAVSRSRARLAIVEEQLSAFSGDAAGLSRALAAIVPHVRDEHCPVCDRDYSEVSSTPLITHLSQRIAELTEQAGRLQALAAEKASASLSLSQAERERASVSERLLTQDARVSLKHRVSVLGEAKNQLAAVAPHATAGAQLMRRHVAAQKRVAELRNRDQRALEVRRELVEMCTALGQASLANAEPAPDAIARVEEYLAKEEARLSGLQQRRREALAKCRQLRQLRRQIAESEAVARAHAVKHSRLEGSFAAAERRRIVAKTIAQSARDARTAIASRVFNESLNTVWRDLFVRLAPAEPFVPAFKLPDDPDDAVVAVLETLHRGGGRGGSPGAMLSAGNLNTAALTLFLALHLSINARLPWLIFDDPVQSMDEVHISQFAALLRTLSKAHGRQVVVALHDRPLFDYLTLELSPAFQTDRLITVDLGRSSTGQTVAEPRFFGWEPDPAVAA